MDFEMMNVAYREKHFPKGSVLAQSAEKNKKSSIGLIIILFLVNAALCAGGYAVLSSALYHQQAGHSNQFGISVVLVSIFLLLILLCVWGMIKLAKGSRQGVDAAVRNAAKASDLTENEIREFDRQAMQPDTRILKLTGAVSAAFANQSDGLLTRDYLWLGTLGNHIMKREELIGGCLRDWTYYNGKKRVHSLSVTVVNRKKQMISAETEIRRGRALLELLKTVQPAFRMTENIVKEGQEFDDWVESITST